MKPALRSAITRMGASARRTRMRTTRRFTGSLAIIPAHLDRVRGATGPPIAARDRVTAHPPEGFRYVPDVIDEEQERTLLEYVSAVPLSAVVMRGYAARRRTAHFGVVYGF